MSSTPLSARTLTLRLFLAVTTASVCASASSACPVPGSVNAVLGDESFVRAFGRLPNANTAEDLRIATHLAYVEELLRARDVRSWPSELREARERNLDRLRAYRTAGSFPRHEGPHAARTPRFIDHMGRICAVGYLVEQSAGRELAEAINARFQEATIVEMESQALGDWASASGLSVRELAMIQPCYGCMWDCLHLEGRAWTDPGFNGGEFRTVGIVTPTSPMVHNITINGQLTMHLRGTFIQRDKYYDLYRNGQFGIYEDPSSPATFAAFPPNPVTPGSFTDGETFLAGTGAFAVTRSNGDVGFIGYFTATNGVHLDQLHKPDIEIHGSLEPITEDGYEFVWTEVVILGYCRYLEPVEPTSWGRIKATYRSR